MVEPEPSDFGSALRKLRVAAGFSQEQLADRAGVSLQGRGGVALTVARCVGDAGDGGDFFLDGGGLPDGRR